MRVQPPVPGPAESPPNRVVPGSISVFSDFLPRYDASSANLRVSEIVSILVDAGYEVRYHWWLQQEGDEKYLSRFADDITFHAITMNPESIIDHTLASRCDLVWFTNLWGTDWLDCILTAMTTLRVHRPLLPLIVDTMDFHAKKYYRKYARTGDNSDLILADTFCSLENLVYKAADCIVTVSEREAQDIQAAFGHPTPTCVVGNIHHLSPTTLSFECRRHLVFLGNYKVPHNIDALRWFLEHSFPAIRSQLPETELHLLGKEADHLPGEISCSPGVRVTGFVEDIPAALASYRAMIVPLTYGAGMKGKVGSGACCGLPIVTTSIGAEGYPLRHGYHALIADTPEMFAKSCVEIHTDKVLWERISHHSYAMIRDTFSSALTAKTLLALVHSYTADRNKRSKA